MFQITKLAGLTTISLITISVSACNEKSPEASQNTTIEQTENHAALRSEIQKLLQEKKHDPIILRDSLRDMTWKDIRLIFDDTKNKLDRASVQPTRDVVRIRAIAQLKKAFNNLDIEKSKKHGNEALIELERGLQEMAEKEGKASK